jgi:hypothetical protein
MSHDRTIFIAVASAMAGFAAGACLPAAELADDVMPNGG